MSSAETLLEDESPDYDWVVQANDEITGALGELVPLTTPVYRLYNQWSLQHLYTTDVNEYETLQEDGWTGEGAYWYAPDDGVGTYQVARLYNPYNGSHYYLKADDTAQMDELLDYGWLKDGEEVWFNSADPVTGFQVYTLFNPYSSIDTHVWTTDENEYETLIAAGWEANETVIWARSLP